MHSAVTGGNGFVGSALCLRLRELGHEVRAIVRPSVLASEQVTRLAQAGAQLHGAELADPNSLAAAFAGVEVVFHCASEGGFHASPEALSWINVAGSENVLKAARHVGARRVVQLSCANASLLGRARVHWKENGALGQAPLGALARSQLLAEELALHASDGRLSVVALRPAWLWGPGERNNLAELAAEAAGGGVRLFASGSALFSSAHVDNVVAALIAAGRSEQGGGQAFHVADPDYLTSGEFFAQLSRALRWPPPRRGLYALEYARAWLRRARGAAGPWPEQVALRGRASLLDCLQVNTVLGFTPHKTVEQGMRELAAWGEAFRDPSAFERLARPIAGAAEIAHHVKIADALADE
jgi:nucleoside-diphosphate-sugar epimerase